jgi:hypothetical protein
VGKQGMILDPSSLIPNSITFNNQRWRWIRDIRVRHAFVCIGSRQFFATTLSVLDCVWCVCRAFSWFWCDLGVVIALCSNPDRCFLLDNSFEGDLSHSSTSTTGPKVGIYQSTDDAAAEKRRTSPSKFFADYLATTIQRSILPSQHLSTSRLQLPHMYGSMSWGCCNWDATAHSSTGQWLSSLLSNITHPCEGLKHF